MATQKRSTNGNGHGNGRQTTFDPALVMAQAQQVTASANEIAVVAGEVSEGAEEQLKSLSDAAANLAGMTTSLRQTATNAESVAAATEVLVSGVTEMAASIEQVSTGSAHVATALAQSATALKNTRAKRDRSQKHVRVDRERHRYGPPDDRRRGERHGVDDADDGISPRPHARCRGCHHLGRADIRVVVGDGRVGQVDLWQRRRPGGRSRRDGVLDQ
jgi:hypothetical protein